MTFRPSGMNRGAKNSSLDVVEVQMGEQDVDPACTTGEPEPEVADTRAGVEHEEPPVRERDLEARGVAAVPIRRGTPGWEPRRVRPTL